MATDSATAVEWHDLQIFPSDVVHRHTAGEFTMPVAPFQVVMVARIVRVVARIIAPIIIFTASSTSISRGSAF